MKKIIAFLLTLMLTVNLSFTLVHASDSASDDAQELYDASLFKAIGIDVNASSHSHLTRSEFLYILVQSIGYKPSAIAEDLPFSDVDAESFYAGVLKYALDSGIISKASKFYPDAPVKYDEACKMAVSALGYDYYAIAHGGYPAGYVMAADNCDLLMGVSSGEYLSYNDAFMMLENLLHANVYSPSGYYIENETMTVYEKGNTVLAVYHDIVFLEDAVISATPYTGLYEGDGACDISQIEINDVVFRYYGNSIGLIGKRADVYYKKGSQIGEVIFIRVDDADIVKISADSIYEISDRTVKYTVNDSDKRINIAASPAFIYNNRARTGFKLAALSDLEGTVGFVDNNDDGKYDVVYIMECRVMIAQDIDIYAKSVIGDDGTRISLGSNDIISSIEKGGVPIDFTELHPGDVMQIYSSTDGKVVTIMVSQRETVTGEVTELDENGRKIYIDSVAYSYSSDFALTDLRYCKLSSRVTLALTDAGVVAACIKSENKVLYGYYITAKQSAGLDDTIRVKIFSQHGEFVVCTLADTVTYNGVTTPKSDVYKLLTANSECLIRYISNTDNVIRMIDTQNNVGVLTDDLPDEDNLTLYQYPTDAYNKIMYVTKTSFIHPYFRIASDTVVFRVIDDDSFDEEKRYSLGNISYFKANRQHIRKNLLAYNVKESGDAGAIVVKTTSAGTDISDDAPGGLVVSANLAIDTRGEVVVALVIYNSNTYTRYYIEDEAILADMDKDASFSNIPVKMGDYVRFNVGLRNNITAIVRDFKYDPDHALRTVEYKFDNHIKLTYYYGTPYMREGDVVSIVPENFPSHADGFNDPTLRYRLPLTSAITVYDTASDTVYEGSLIDIITYTESEVDCGKLLIKTDSGNLLDVVYYK